MRNPSKSQNDTESLPPLVPEAAPQRSSTPRAEENQRTIRGALAPPHPDAHATACPGSGLVPGAREGEPGPESVLGHSLPMPQLLKPTPELPIHLFLRNLEIISSLLSTV